MNIISLPQLAWHDTRELELPLPDSWKVDLMLPVSPNMIVLLSGLPITIAISLVD